MIRDAWRVSRTSVLTHGQSARIQPLLPSSAGRRGRPFRTVAASWREITAALESSVARRCSSPRTRPDRALANKAYSSKAIRIRLPEHSAQCVIPETNDQKANRKSRGSAGGRAVTYERTSTNCAMSLSAVSKPSSNGAPWPPAATSWLSPTAQRPFSRRRHLEHSIGRLAL